MSVKKSAYQELENQVIELKKAQIDAIIDKDNQDDLFFDSMTEMVEMIEHIYDRQGRRVDFYIREINLSFAEFLSKTKEQLINEKVSSIIATVEDFWLTSFANVGKTGVPTTFENYGAEFDKYYFVTSWKASMDKAGISFTDITKAKKAENAVDETQQMPRSFIHKVPSIIIGLTADGKIIEFNPEAEKMFERNRTEVLDKNYFDLFIPESLRTKVKSDMKQILSGTMPYKFENLVKSATDNQLKIEWTAHKLYDEKGILTGIITISENITKL